MDIQDIAEKFDAAIITNNYPGRRSEVAIRRRHYDEETGLILDRYFPDQCDFRPEADWEAASPEQVEAWVC